MLLTTAVLQMKTNLYLLFLTAVFLALLAYELTSGNAIDLRWGRFVRKSDRPNAYCGMVVLKTAFALFMLYKALS